ncbi:hypothetical protein [Porticoccus sp.]
MQGIFCALALSVTACLCNVATAYDAGADVTTRYGVIEGGRNPVSERPDHLLWNGQKVLEFDDGYVAVEKVFQMSNYDVALVAQNAGGSSSVSTYNFLILKPNGRYEVLTDEEMQSDDGTFEVSRQGNIISINFGYSGGLQRSVKLDGMQLVIKAKKSGKAVALTQNECSMLYEGLNECREIHRKDRCSVATSTFSTFTTSWLKAAKQKPGFDIKGYESLCSQLCIQNTSYDKPVFEKRFCGR